jgi:hypothetical protein
MWQINKTTKKCQTCAKALGVNEDFFSALFYGLVEPAQAETKPDKKVCPPLAAPQETKETDSVADVQQLNRQDFCSNCWERRMASGDETPFSFWQTKYTKVPEPPKTPKQILISFFDNLFETLKTEVASQATPTTSEAILEPSQANAPADPASVRAQDKLKAQAKYLFALILMRKKILKLRETQRQDLNRTLILERSVDAKMYQVPEVSISEEELAALRDQFSNLFEFRI